MSSTAGSEEQVWEVAPDSGQMPLLLRHKKELGLLLGVVVAILVAIFLPMPDSHARYTFAIIIWGVICLIFGSLPDYVISLMIIFIPIVLRISPPEVALKATVQFVWWMFIVGFIIGVAFNKSGLAKRISLYCAATMIKGWYSALLAIFMMNVVLNVIAPFTTIAGIAITVSIATALARGFGYEPGTKVFNGLAIAAVASNLAAGELIYTGWLLNPLLVNLLARYFPLDFYSWFKYITPPAALWLVISYAVVAILFKPDNVIAVDRAALKARFKEVGKWTSGEMKTLTLTLLILVFFIAQPFLHGLQPGWIAVLISVLFFAPYIGPLEPREFGALNWTFVFFILGMFSIGDQLVYHQVNVQLAAWVMPGNIQAWNLILASMCCAVILVLMHFAVATMIPLIACFVPAFCQFSVAHHMAIIPLFGVVLFSAKRWVLPFQEAMVVMAQGMTRDELSSSALIRVGIVMSIFLVVVQIPLSTLYWLAIKAP
jgi:di/tricarboxylate transporter